MHRAVDGASNRDVRLPAVLGWSSLKGAQRSVNATGKMLSARVWALLLLLWKLQ